MKNQRPLSPHLQVYRPQLTSVLSILHRITGVIMAISALLIAMWFWLLVANPAAFATLNGLLASPIGKLLLFLWTFCSSYHLLNGIRHLFWDAGYGFDLDRVYLSGKLVVSGAVVLTTIIWLL